MAVLFSAFGGDFDNGVSAAGVNCAAQKTLYKKPPRHSHLKEIAFNFVSNFKLNSGKRGDCVTFGLENASEDFGYGRLAFSASDANHCYFPRRVLVTNVG